MNNPNLLNMTFEIVKSQVIAPDKISSVINDTYQALLAIHRNECTQTTDHSFMVELGDNHGVFEDYIICLEDNTRHKSLKRYIKTKFHITWKEYLDKHNLPEDYPSCSLSMSKRRSEIAKEIKLGHKGVSHVEI